MKGVARGDARKRPLEERDMVAVTETSAATQAAGGAPRERPQQAVPRPSSQAAPANEPVTLASTDGAKAEPAPTLSPIGFTLHFDGDSQRLILEAREPASGYLIVQIPPKYVVKQFSATVRSNLEPSRGKGLNDAV
jgi:hypothetical protein